jgi:isopentenyl phosphate kinase
MEKLILIKLGGSLITDKKRPFVARLKVMERLSKELKVSCGAKALKIILGHGGGSFPHPIAAKYQTQKGVINSNSIKGFPLVADAAREVNRLMVKSFLKEGIKAVSFSPLSFIYTRQEKEKISLTDHLQKALDLGLTPVIYGDVVMDEKMGFCIYSGEKTLNLLAQKLKGKYEIEVIYCGETDGVYGHDGKTLTQITPKSFGSVKKYLVGASGVDVTGGMLHKVDECLQLAKKFGISTLIINGKNEGELKRAILGGKTTSTKITS